MNLPHRRLTLNELNALPQEQFCAALGHVFEHTPTIAHAAWMERPFTTTRMLHQALLKHMYQLPAEQQIALICAHPDLAGRAAIAKELTPESMREQASARLDQLTPAQYQRFQELNTAYRTRFNFPFIICVREHTLTSILANFEQRLALAPADEIATALAEIGKIAGLRLRDSVDDSSPP